MPWLYAYELTNLTTGANNFLATARTEASGSVIPGTGLPAIHATLTPSSVPIISGAPEFDFEKQRATAQEGQFGYNNDYTVLIPGRDANRGTLRQRSEASGAGSYDASNPALIRQVFSAVLSNF